MWPAWVVSISAILLYCTVHIEATCIGAFAAVMLLAGYAAVRVYGEMVGIDRRGLKLALGDCVRSRPNRRSRLPAIVQRGDKCLMAGSDRIEETRIARER